MPNKAAKKTSTKSASKRARPAVSRGPRAGSNADAIARLEVGQSISMSRLCRLDELIDGGDEIKEEMAKLRSTASGMISRFKEDDLDDIEFETVSGKFITDDYSRVVLTVLIIRTK